MSELILTSEPSAPKQRKPEVVWRTMTEPEARAIGHFPHVRFRIGSMGKRLARSLQWQAAGTYEITEAQAYALWSLVWTYRRQIPEDVVEYARKRIDER